MAGFKTHITGSTLVGIGYGAAGHAYGLPWSTCVLAGGACSVAGMLPDLDSDSGVPVREFMCFLAAVVPALMLRRFQQLGLSHEHMVLAIVAVYLLVRFGIGGAFRRYTAHRGMWHSLPAAAVAGLFVLLLAVGDTLNIRLYKALAVCVGFVTHLVMDELWSVDLSGGRPRLKSSFGTALKLWTTNNWWSNVSVYGKLFLLLFLVIGDPYVMQHWQGHSGDLPKSTSEWIARAKEHSRQLVQTLRHRTQQATGRAAAAPLPEPAAPTARISTTADSSGWGPAQEPAAVYGAGPAAQTASRSLPLAPVGSVPTGAPENAGVGVPAPVAYPPTAPAAPPRMPFDYPAAASPARR